MTMSTDKYYIVELATGIYYVQDPHQPQRPGSVMNPGLATRVYQGSRICDDPAAFFKGIFPKARLVRVEAKYEVTLV